jgi:hypothetical protein
LPPPPARTPRGAPRALAPPPPRAAPRAWRAARACAIAVTLVAALATLLAPGGGGGGGGGTRLGPRAAAAAAAAAAPGGCAGAAPLPSGVLSLAPCPARGDDVFAAGATRLVVTFFGAHMNLWYRTSLRTLVLLHCADPRARVLVWANELTAAWLEEHFGDLRDERGAPRLFLVRYDVAELARGLPGAEASLAYLTDANLAAAGVVEPQMLMAHVTDVLRMVILYRFGGVYLDADILALRPLTGYGTAFAANFGNYDCTTAIQPGWPSAGAVALPAALGAPAPVSCMCVCFLSFPAPGHALLREVMDRGLAAFVARGGVYGGFGAWVFMDALRALAGAPGFDARPVSVGEVLCWPAVMDAATPLEPAAVAAILRDCAAVHMMGGGHAKKFGALAINASSLFGQVYEGAASARPTKCAARAAAA